MLRPLFTHGRNITVLNGQEASGLQGWSGRFKKILHFLGFVGNRTMISGSSNRNPSHFTDWAISAGFYDVECHEQSSVSLLRFYVLRPALSLSPSPFSLFPSPPFHTWIYTETGCRVRRPTHSFHSHTLPSSVYVGSTFISRNHPTFRSCIFCNSFFFLLPFWGSHSPCILPQLGGRKRFLGSTMRKEWRWLGKERCFFSENENENHEKRNLKNI